MNNLPSYDRETALRSQGYTAIAGVDEVGRGPLAGPVVAAAAVLPPHLDALGPEVVRDSKLLTPRQRERAYDLLIREATTWSVGQASHEEIDALGIAPASRLAMARALENLTSLPDFLLIDAFPLPEVALPQESIIHGDRLCLSIAAASVIAKVTRDRMMQEEDRRNPGYGFARHKGYATREHLARLQALGPSPIHRRSFAPVRDLVEGVAGQRGEVPQSGHNWPGGLKVPLSPKARVGAQGEAMAAAYLQRQGYAIIERNYRCPEGEVDVVARERDTLVFVEVRTRRGSGMGTPQESVTAAKRERLIAVAQRFLLEHPESPADWRIDLIAIQMGQGGRSPHIEHLRHAVTFD